MPLLTLDEFFAGDTDEESIAPGRWGYGRPPIAVPAERLRAIERRGDVAWVRVRPPPEAVEAGYLCAEAVAVCTTADGASCSAWAGASERASWRAWWTGTGTFPRCGTGRPCGRCAGTDPGPRPRPGSSARDHPPGVTPPGRAGVR